MIIMYFPFPLSSELVELSQYWPSSGHFILCHRHLRGSLYFLYVDRPVVRKSIEVRLITPFLLRIDLTNNVIPNDGCRQL